jgi:lipopolysaccharide transport system ATP-binding protein
VGTGFHQELTGRENIYLSGAILGMGRSEIRARFDEIVAFAEVERFLDTSVKHYSSGMYLRLAFAVAAHLQTEILLVDEVLAVGDLAFQRKCLGKVGEVATQGRTVFLVSHNMEAILNLSSRGLVLSRGDLVFDGAPEDAVGFYRSQSLSGRENREPHVLFQEERPAEARGARITRVEMLDPEGLPKKELSTWDDLLLRIHYWSPEEIRRGTVVLDIRDQKDQRLIVLDSGTRVPLHGGAHFVDCRIPRFPLAAGEYFLAAGLAVSNLQWLWRGEGIGVLRVDGRDVFEIGRPPVYSRMMVAAEHEWLRGEGIAS